MGGFSTSYQDYITFAVRDAAVLTNSYVAGNIIGATQATSHTYGENQLILYVGVTLTLLTSVEIKIEFSADGTTYYQETVSDLVSTPGTSADLLLEHSVSASGNYRIAVPLKDKFVKVSLKGTGNAAGSSATVLAIIGTA